MNSIDKDITDRVAELWIELGGDLLGFDMCWGYIREAIEKIELAGEDA